MLLMLLIGVHVLPVLPQVAAVGVGVPHVMATIAAVLAHVAAITAQLAPVLTRVLQVAFLHVLTHLAAVLPDVPAVLANISGVVPDPLDQSDPDKRKAYERALAYMGLTPGQKITEIPLDTVFIGSCTNSRLEDLRLAAQYVKGKHVAPQVRAMVVPGSMQVRRLAEEEGLAEIFREAGFQWREAGCSMCIAMNGDQLSEGERCASTSNRNFEGRQGRGGRTHLVSPAMAAAAAIAGHFVDIREM